jgi:Amt family ammonium transporter
MLFAAYQGMFAVITPALISGGFVDRMRFGPYCILLILWLTLVYTPLGYWNWGGGWMFQLGAWDFAGGIVVHVSAGFSAVGVLLVLGRRVTPPSGVFPKPHNMQMILLGTAMLWFGWFGFNGGSALSIGGLATIAFVNTQIAPSAAMCTWVVVEWIVHGKPSLNGACAGVVAGLVVITPSAGFIQPAMAALAGVIGAVWCFTAVELVKKKTNLDDTCDTFGVHGMAGFLGTIFVGVLSDPEICLCTGSEPPDFCQLEDGSFDKAPDWCANPGTVTRSWHQFQVQAFCTVVASLYSVSVTYVLTLLITKTNLRLFGEGVLKTAEQQETTRDEAMYGESVMELEDLLAEQLGMSAALDKIYGSDEENEHDSDYPRQSPRVLVSVADDGSDSDDSKGHKLLC